VTRTLVLGAAVSGAAAARLARRMGHSVTVYDERPEALFDLMGEGFGTISGTWDVVDLTGIDLVVTSPGIPERARPIVDTLESHLPLWSEIELAWRQLSEGTSVVAVTGTNGKTTVTGLIADMLIASGVEARAVGNIGTPLADVVGEELESVVIEVSSFQLHYCDAFRPDVAVVTNVAPDHLDWHGTFDRYLEAKARIVANQRSSDVLVYCADDPGAARVAERAPGRRIGVRTGAVAPDGFGVDRAAGRLRLGSAEVAFDRLHVEDGAFLIDLAIAAAAAFESGATADGVISVCEAFRPSSHRRTLVGERGGVRFVDDSKATNPHAAITAIRDYPSVVLIAGGLAKGLDIGPLATEPNVKHVVAIGTSASDLVEAGGEKVTVADSMRDAVEQAWKHARDGDVVLLAPGSASFDMFDSYGHRGDVFAAEVRELFGGVDGGGDT
jgi:UDP-N-acetylmuramoylalanine--D-glutamate ligase